MALGFEFEKFEINAELKKDLSSVASFVSSRPSATPLDDKSINSVFNRSSGSPFFGRGRTSSQEEEASTSSGEEDLSSVQSIFSPYSGSIAGKDSDISDDDKALSPRSSVGDVTTCVYSAIFLLRVQAACCGRAHTSKLGYGTVLGYRTEPVPEDDLPSPKASATTYQAPKQLRKRSSKSCHATSMFDQLPKAAPLPESAADSWVSKRRANVASGDDDAKVIRAARSILNKLTIEKFDSLFDQLVACGINTPHHISMLMREVFEKATAQHHFIPMYAELCVRLSSNPHIASIVEEAGHLHNFKRLLLDQCQNVFEELLEPCDAESSSGEEAQMLRKKRALGNIKLVGELLVQGMLSSSLLVECGKMLLDSRTTCREALESLAALLMVAGEKFDTNTYPCHGKLLTIFSDMDGLTRDKSTPPRVRFLLRDVLDVRSAGWRTSANQTALKAAPMKLEEVREKALEEQVAASPKSCRGSVGGNSMRGKSNGSITSLLSVMKGKSSTPTHASGKVTEKVTPAPVSPSNVQVTKQADVPLPASAEHFDLVTFRRALASTLYSLSCDKNIPAAVQSIRLQQVPIKFQADQLIDILSRIVEERRGAVRRCELAFVAGLMASEKSPFDRKVCLDGIRRFFQEVFAEMCNEVQRLPAIMKSEFVPTMSSVFSASELNEVLPEAMRMK